MTPQEKQAFWEQHVQAWRLTKLSQRAYCQHNDLSLVRFTYWRRRLSANKTPATRKLIPVVVQRSPSQAQVRLHLPGGIQLEVPVNVLEEVLPIVSRVAQGAV